MLAGTIISPPHGGAGQKHAPKDAPKLEARPGHAVHGEVARGRPK